MLTPFTFQLIQAVFYPLSLSAHQKSKPVSQDVQLQRCGTGHLQNQGQQSLWPCILQHSQAEPLNSLLKGGHFLLEVGQQRFERLTFSVLLFVYKPYFLFLKPLLSLFVNYELALRPGDWISSNSESASWTGTYTMGSPGCHVFRLRQEPHYQLTWVSTLPTADLRGSDPA
jgi:hypothetical protein